MASLRWAATSTERRIVVLAEEVGDGAVLSFGDATTRPVGAGVPVAHDYGQPGVYWASVADGAGAQAWAQVDVRPPLEPAFTPSAVPGAEYEVSVSFAGERAAPVLVDFGDGSDPVRTWATPEARLARFVPAGSYTGTVRDLGTQRTTAVDYTVVGPVADPDFTITRGSDELTAVVELTAASGEVAVDFGDGQTAALDGQVGASVSHTYVLGDSPSGDGVFFVMASYADGGAPTVKAVQLPFT